MYRGLNLLGTDLWICEYNEGETRLMRNAVPVTRMEAAPEVYALNRALAETVMEEDFPVLFGKPVLMDVPAFQFLAKKFPQNELFKKIDIVPVKETSCVTSIGNPLEIFGNGKKAQNLNFSITPASKDVITLSQINDFPDACGSCIIPTDFGNSIVLVQELDNWNLWTFYRRKMILDALDSLIPHGGLSVRLITGGFSVCTIGRTTSTGTTAGAYLLNCGIGRTMPLELAIRRSEYRDYWLIRPEEKAERLIPIRESADEKVYMLPPLEAWRPALVSGML